MTETEYRGMGSGKRREDLTVSVASECGLKAKEQSRISHCIAAVLSVCDHFCTMSFV